MGLFCFPISLSLITFQTITANFVQNRFQQRCAPNSRLLPDENLRLNMRSRGMCVGFCTNEDKCLAIAFSKVEKTCLIYNILADEACINTVVDPGYDYYEKVCELQHKTNACYI